MTTSLAALRSEVERLSALPDYQCAVELPEVARRLDLPVATLERQIHRPALDAVDLGRRLSRLVYLLSENPVVAARAIEVALHEAGKDWSYLASLVAQAEPGAVDDAQEWIEAGNELLTKPLSDKEREFVTDMINRYSSWGHFEPSEKQVKWFVSLWQRWCRGA